VLSGIPRIGAEAAALFRILLAAGLVMVLGFDDAIGRPDGVGMAYAPGSGYGTGTWTLAHWLRQQPMVHGALHVAAIVLAVAVGAGVATRISAALLCVSVFLLVSATLVTTGNHAWGAPLLALLALPLTPLGDAWSVDVWWRHRRGRPAPAPEPSAAYGFALWWIGLVLGTALLAAAYAKLATSGVSWVTNGAIRYHFVEDAGNAVVPWGLWIAGHQGVAIAVSAAAILVEATMILNVVRRSDGYRAVFGVMGLSLHIGFFLFQGVLWWPWVVLYIAFLPWQRISQRLQGPRVAVPRAASRRLSAVHALAVVVVIGQQGYASYHRREFEPLYSHYPMYSGTFASWDAFFQTRRWYKYQRYAFVLRTTDGQRFDLKEPVALITPSDQGRLIDTLYALYSGLPVDQRSLDALAALRQRITAHVGREVDTIDVFVDAQRIHFDSMRIDTPVKDLHAFTLRLSPPELVVLNPAFAALPATPAF
jgi:hypothetical protein